MDEEYGNNKLSSVENFDGSAVNLIQETPSQDVKQPNFEIIFQELNRISCNTSDVWDIKEMIVRLQDKLNNVVPILTDSCSKDMNAEQLCQLENTFKKAKKTVSEEHSELDEVVGDKSVAGVADVEENVVNETLSDFRKHGVDVAECVLKDDMKIPDSIVLKPNQAAHNHSFVAQEARQSEMSTFVIADDAGHSTLITLPTLNTYWIPSPVAGYYYLYARGSLQNTQIVTLEEKKSPNGVHITKVKENENKTEMDVDPNNGIHNDVDQKDESPTGNGIHDDQAEKEDAKDEHHDQIHNDVDEKDESPNGIHDDQVEEEDKYTKDEHEVDEKDESLNGIHDDQVEEEDKYTKDEHDVDQSEKNIPSCDGIHNGQVKEKEKNDTQDEMNDDKMGKKCDSLNRIHTAQQKENDIQDNVAKVDHNYIKTETKSDGIVNEVTIKKFRSG